jgi:mono/diheme cytochrome c family protein
MKRVQLEIIIGTILVLLSAAILIVLGVREPDRLAKYDVEQAAAKIEFGASVFEANCTRCHGSQAQGIPGVAPSLRSEEFFTQRIDEVGWGGGLEDYIVSVVTVGRQVSTRPGLYVGGGSPAMPTWSEKFGGPLALVDESDPIAFGQATFTAAGCVACHTITGISTGTVGPVLDGVATRAGSRVAGLTAEEYIRQSIREPSAYVVDGFEDGIMPQTFADTLSQAQIDSLVAFLLTQE